MKAVLIFIFVAVIIGVLAKDDNPNIDDLRQELTSIDETTSKYIERNKEAPYVDNDNPKNEYHDSIMRKHLSYPEDWWNYWDPILLNREIKKDLDDKTKTIDEELEDNSDYHENCEDLYYVDQIRENERKEEESDMAHDTQNYNSLDAKYTKKNLSPWIRSYLKRVLKEGLSDRQVQDSHKKAMWIIDDKEPLKNLQRVVTKDGQTKEQCYVKAFVNFGKCFDKKKSIVTCMLDSLEDFAKCVVMNTMTCNPFK